MATVSPEALNGLEYIRRATSGDAVRGQFPDFLILGPQRTGTTWVHANLKLHPELFLSYPKELYYFNSVQKGAHAFSRHVRDFEWPTRLRDMRPTVRRIAQVVYFDVLKTGRMPAYSLEWYMRFFHDPFWLRAYKNRRSLRRYGVAYQPRMYGEATATYATLDEGIIRDIVRINPEMKALLMVRDPVERAWSHAKMSLVRDGKRSMEDLPRQAFYDFFTSDYQLACGQFSAHIDKWRRCLKPGHLKVGLYADIQERPAVFLVELLEFLGVSADRRYLGDDIGDRVNPTSAMKIPPHFQRFLEALFAEERERLNISGTTHARAMHA